MKAFIEKHKKDILFALLIFLIALQVRGVYQDNTWMGSPVVRGDSTKYVSVAFNLKYHGVYSEKTPNLRETPELRSDLRRGYPLFLIPFVNEDLSPYKRAKTDWDGSESYRDLLKTQGVMGALTVLLVFLICRQFFSFGLSIIPTMLTAVNPHFIALESFILTETLFIFVLTLALYLMILAWRYKKTFLVFMAGITLSLCFEIRELAYLLPIFLSVVFVLGQKKKIWLFGKENLKRIKVIVLTMIVVFVSSFLFTNFYTKGLKAPDTAKESPGGVASFLPINGIKNIFTPSAIFVYGKDSMVEAVYDLKLEKKDVKGFTTKTFLEEPRAYVNWVLWGKLAQMWNFESTYTGIIYFYYVNYGGFYAEDSPILLKAIYYGMYYLHWPLFILTLLGLIIYLISFLKRKLKENEIYLMVPALTFVYFMGLLYFISANLSRYTVPVRHISYMLAMIPFIYLFRWWRKKKA